jgi:hypothetical protein
MIVALVSVRLVLIFKCNHMFYNSIYDKNDCVDIKSIFFHQEFIDSFYLDRIVARLII